MVSLPCAICFEDITVPAALRCGHVLDLDCLKNSLRRRPNCCPICREEDRSPPRRLFIDRSETEEASTDGGTGKLYSKRMEYMELQLSQLELDKSDSNKKRDEALKAARKSQKAEAEVRRQFSDLQNRYADKKQTIKDLMSELHDFHDREESMGEEVDRLIEENSELRFHEQSFSQEVQEMKSEVIDAQNMRMLCEAETKRKKVALSRAMEKIDDLNKVIERLRSERNNARAQLQTPPQNPRSHALRSPPTTSSRRRPISPIPNANLRVVSKISKRSRAVSEEDIEFLPMQTTVNSPLHSSPLINRRKAEEFHSPQAKRRKGGPNAPSEVSVIKVKGGKPTSAVAVGPIHSRRI